MPTNDPARPGQGEPRDNSFARPHLFVTALLVCLYVVARLWRLDATCLWFDEVFSLHAARHTWVGLWRFAAADLIHPPLFYALLKIWTATGGDSLLWLRLFPALTSIAALVPFLLLARELRLGASATNFALLLLAANGYLIKYAQELRMYSLLLLLALVSLWLFAKLLHAKRETPKVLIALTVANLLLVYTHYYGAAVVACEAAFLAFKDRRKLAPFLLTCAVVVLAFAPWVASVVGASHEGGGLAQNVGWIERPRVADLAQLFALLNEPFYFRQSSAQPLYARGGLLLGLLLTGLPVAALALRSLRRRTIAGAEREAAHDDAVSFLAFFVLLPVALAFAASYALPFSVWGTRHLIVVAAPYALLAGVALQRLRPHWLKSAALVLLCCWFFTAGALTLLRREGAYIWCTWDGLVRSAVRDESAAHEANTNNVQEASARVEPVNIYAFEDLVAYHLWFALDASGERRMKVSVLKNIPGVAEDPAYFLPRRFDGVATASADSIVGPSFWAAFRADGWDESQPPLKTLLERGYCADRIYETSAQGQRAFLVLFTRSH